VGLTRSLDGIHPDNIRRIGKVVAPGQRHQISREWCYLIGARVGRKSGSGEATIRFFTSALPDESQSDETQGLVIVDENASGGAAGEELMFASFENGIFVEVHANGAAATDAFILTVAWVIREEFTPAFGDPTCQLKEAWAAAPCRKDTELHSDYGLGTPAEVWDGAPGGFWEGDGVEYILDEVGDPILDSSGAALYSSSGT
jgi:hypothetical protein